MRNERMRKKTLSRILSLCLAVTILCSAFIFVEGTELALAAEGDNFDVMGQNADNATQDNMGFNNIPMVHDGRIWTDKSVVVRPDDAFDVTLSALSQSFSVTAGYQIPSDIVIIIDVSGSMAQYVVPGTNLPRIAVLIDALNEALEILMSANPLNRVAIVAYGGRTGGYARVEHVLGLGRYLPSQTGDFFSVQYRETGSSNTVYVDALVETGSGGSIVTSSVAVIGSTPTQWGVYEGANILRRVPQGNVPGGTHVSVPVFDEDGNHTENRVVTRRPNIILMTDGEPTMGWPDWAFSGGTVFGENPLTPGPTGTQLNRTLGRFYGDGSNGEMGVSLLNVLTAAHRKRLVHQHYFGDVPVGNPIAGEPAADVGFYTISLGQLDRPLINAMMDPENHDIGPTNVTGGSVEGTNPEYNVPNAPGMRARLQAFTANASAGTSFYALYRYAFGDYRWTENESFVEISNFADRHITMAEVYYPTEFFPVNDVGALEDAFMDIAFSIQESTLFGNIVNVRPEAADFDGWLVFSDVLGEYMQFRGITNLIFPAHVDGQGNEIRGAVTGTPINVTAQRGRLETILVQHFNYRTPGTAPNIPSLINASIDAGFNNSVRYFADRNRNWVANYHPTNIPANADAMVEIFPMTGTVTSPLDGEDNDLIYIAFHVVTVLRDGVFSEIADIPGEYVSTSRTLRARDQLIRWYIPASLIPMRMVDSREGATFGQVSLNRNPIRVTYTVGLDRARVNDGVSALYQAENPAPDGMTWFYSNRWREPSHVTLGHNVTLAFYEPHRDNPFYTGDTVGWADGRRTTVPKQPNITVTAPHATVHGSFVTGDTRTVMHWLGNNGRLTARLPGDLGITKEFAIDDVVGQFPPSGVTFTQPITFRIFGPGFAGEQVRTFPNDFTWSATLNRYVMSNPLDDLEPGRYTVVKSGGSVTGGPGHGFNYISQPEVAYVEVPANGIGIVSFRNDYETRQVPPSPNGELEIMKAFIFDSVHGFVEDRIFTTGITFTVTGPGIPADAPIVLEFNEENFRRCENRSAYTLRDPHPLQDLVPGEYTVRKTGGQIADWFYVHRDEEITVTVASGATVVAAFVNVYSTVEPPTPPITQPPGPDDETAVAAARVPQTGDENQIGLYVAILLVALFLATATVVIYIRLKRRN